jgi:hypothetical protein
MLLSSVRVRMFYTLPYNLPYLSTLGTRYQLYALV